ncbi:hypothetical protein D3C72_2564220 [compost metagenome]
MARKKPRAAIALLRMRAVTSATNSVATTLKPTNQSVFQIAVQNSDSRQLPGSI